MRSIVFWYSGTFGWVFWGRGRWRCIEHAPFADALAGDGLHGGGHVDVKVAVGGAGLQGWGFCGVGGCCLSCV